jgi:hypothetical protein
MLKSGMALGSHHGEIMLNKLYGSRFPSLLNDMVMLNKLYGPRLPSW